ncbi:MAG: DDE-type integrase/transposase/recombinase [Candidatus Margulisbacteria bacterium]|nr:DDE-type integrase/transposase/recombinase [Candidatus Margulisiibacteriota bacterium]
MMIWEPVKEDREKAERIALFRHGIISPVLYEREEGQNKYFKKLSEQEHYVPGVGLKKYSVSTFKSWLSVYREKGYVGLKPRVRKDKGISRKITPKFAGLLRQILREYPIITYSLLYSHLITEGYIRPYDFTIPTLIKFMKDNKIYLKEKTIVPRRKFEKEHINELWMCDFMHSGTIRDGKKKRETYLCAIIDDCSRVIVGSLWGFSNNLILTEECLKTALLTYGCPKKFYCDNAKVFRSKDLHLPCAKLGIAVIHSRPFESAPRGKIERFFRTVRMKFLPLIDRNKINLEQLNSKFQDWLSKDYHKIPHQGIGEPPIEKFIKDLDNVVPVRVTKEEIDLTFYRTLQRKVKNDSTVSIGRKLYEVPSKYISLNVEIRYPSSRPEELYIFQDDKPCDKLKPLQIHQNANPPKVSLSYTNLLGREKN